MKSLHLNSRKIEVLIYVFVWTLVFAVPFFSERNAGQIQWDQIARHWLNLGGFLLIFLINVYVLVPRFLLEKRYLPYFISVTLIIFLLVTTKLIAPQGNPPQPATGHALEIRTPDPNQPMPKPPFMVFVDHLIICILVLGAGTTVRLMSKWLSEEKLRRDAEKEQLKTNLALLRHQVSPHFFMNTLNNIHSLIQIDTEKAQDAVERLSVLMRYLLYDSAQNTIELKKEIEFIHSFISLMQLRHSDEVKVITEIPESLPDVKIPPMLFISLLENAFKHGVSYPNKSYIHFEIQIIQDILTCRIKNSKHKIASKSQGEYSGIGLENIRQSLRLLYEDEFLLKINDQENEFEVLLTIPI
jgi:hypothetical protein